MIKRFLTAFIFFTCIFFCNTLVAQEADTLTVKKKEDKKEKKEKAEDSKEEKDQKEEDEKITFHPEVQAGIIMGGEISDGRFIHKSGKLLELIANFRFSNRVYYGFGGGVEVFKEETFIPVYVHFKGMLNKTSSTSFITAQIGYAAAENKSIYSFTNYQYSGGIFFSPGWGYRLNVKDKYSLMLGINFKHQFANIKYKTDYGKEFKEVLSFNLISFRLGVFF